MKPNRVVVVYVMIPCVLAFLSMPMQLLARPDCYRRSQSGGCCPALPPIECETPCANEPLINDPV